MARPKKSDAVKRDLILRVRMTASEKQKLDTMAEHAGMNVSDFVRIRSLGPDTHTNKAKPERAAFIRGLAELGKIGSNVNQIARALNRSVKRSELFTISGELIENALHGVDTLARHLLKLIEDNGNKR